MKVQVFENERYEIVSPVRMTRDQIRKVYGDASFAYSERIDDFYTVVAVSKDSAPILRSYLLLDGVKFTGTMETVDRFWPEVL